MKAPGDDTLPVAARGEIRLGSSSVALASIPFTPLVVGAFTAIAALYSLLIPRWLPQDEPSHFYYVAWIAGLRNFPHPSGTMLDYELYIQPPLAYLLYSPVLKAAAGLDLAIQLRLLRLVTVAIGAATVFASMKLVELAVSRESGRARAVAGFAGVLIAFNPAFIAVHATVTNDALVDLLTALTLWLALRLVGEPLPERPVFWLVALGVIAGVAASTKALAFPLLLQPVIVVGCWWITRRRPIPWAGLICALVFGILCAIPYYIGNILLYQDPFGRQHWHLINPASHALQWSQAGRLVPLAFASFWEFVTFLRNVLQPKPPVIEYIPFLLLTLAPVAAGVLLWVRGQWRALLTPASAVLGSALLLNILALMYKVLDDADPEGRFFFEMAGPIALIIATSIMYLLAGHSVAYRIVLPGISLFMIAYAGYAAACYLTSAPDMFAALYR